MITPCLRKTILPLLAISGIFLLSACQKEALIDVQTDANGNIVFTITEKWNDTPCIDSIVVTDNENKTVWLIEQSLATMQSDLNICQNRFTYGVTPKYFETEEPAQILQPGKTYIIDPGGPGLVGDKSFTVKQ